VFLLAHMRKNEEKNPLLILGENESAYQLAVEMDRHLPVIWVCPGRKPGGADQIKALENSRLQSVEGANGAFLVDLTVGGEPHKINAAAIIIIPEPHYDLINDFKENRMREQPSAQVLILKEVSPLVFREVVSEGLAAARDGHQVYLVVDEIQVGFADGEYLCQEAREAGVVFLKDAGTDIYARVKDRPGYQGGFRPGRGGHLTETAAAAPYRVYCQTGVLGGEESLVIEADQVWQADNSRIRADYFQILRQLGVVSRRQEDYPFRTCRKGIFVVDSGWGEPFSREETVASLRFLLASYIEEVRVPKVDYEVDPDRCQFCLTCYRVCPHHAIEIGGASRNMYGRAMAIDPGACFNCGRCYAECPAQAILCHNEPDQAPAVRILACENSGGPLLKGTEIEHRLFPCAGAIGFEQMLDSITPGCDRLIIMACRDGKCEHGQGGRRLSMRVRRLNTLLRSLETQTRVEVIRVSAQDKYVIGEEGLRS